MKNGTAIVTGGTGRIGKGVCQALTKAGHTVVTLDVETSRAEGVARAIECDVTDPSACASAVEEDDEKTSGISLPWSTWSKR